MFSRGQGDHSKAIQELTKYLKVFMSDQEAWLELCDLYILVRDSLLSTGTYQIYGTGTSIDTAPISVSALCSVAEP